MVSKTYKIRKHLRSKFYRTIKWEFWPVWIIYFPIIFYILWLVLKYKNPTLFTAAKPAIPMGGVMGVEKSKILNLFKQGTPDCVPDFIVLNKSHSLEEKYTTAINFIRQYPVVVKSDNGHFSS